MLEMRITPELPGYQDLVHSIFLQLIDGGLTSTDEVRALLEPHSPPAPPPAVTIKRTRAKKGADAKKARIADDDEEESDDLDSDDDEDEDEEEDDMEALDLGTDDLDLSLGLDGRGRPKLPQMVRMTTCLPAIQLERMTIRMWTLKPKQRTWTALSLGTTIAKDQTSRHPARGVPKARRLCGPSRKATTRRPLAPV